jgi:hypothetical protein
MRKISAKLRSLQVGGYQGLGEAGCAPEGCYLLHHRGSLDALRLSHRS